MLDCPKCGEPKYDGTTCSACLFSVSSGKQGTAPVQYRCSFVIGERRCRYNATIFENQTRGAHHGVCGGHFRPTPQSALETLVASERNIGTPDYSTKAQVAETISIKMAREASGIDYDPVAVAERAAIQSELLS